jgi:hypothetical protein
VCQSTSYRRTHSALSPIGCVQGRFITCGNLALQLCGVYFSTCVFVMRLVQYVRKVAMHLQKVMEVMSTSVYPGLNPLILFANTAHLGAESRYTHIKGVGGDFHERLHRPESV